MFVREASRLLNNRDHRKWNEACELLLEDAFADGADSGPVNEFRDLPARPFGDDPGGTRKMTQAPLSSEHKFLRTLMQNAERFPESRTHRRPYWTERRTGMVKSPWHVLRPCGSSWPW
ncbi:hypothetical protein LNK82_45950 [Saccharothrix sp. NEAU-S10]|nr:hypothetical protein [Saccharothrix luteola]